MENDKIIQKANQDFDETFNGVISVDEKTYKILKTFFSLFCRSYYQMGKIDATLEKLTKN